MEKTQFSELNLSPQILRAVEEMGFEEATAIQTASIPLIMEGRDVIGHSQTGTGKTAAFGLPAIERIDASDRRTVQVLVLCPTRELAIQACDEIRKFAKYKPAIKAVAIYGGQPIERQFRSLKEGAQIVIGTPGRVMDHMRRGTLKLGAVKMLILDEADEMLNMGFIDDIETILRDVPSERQTILFSATMSPEIIAITENYQKNPELIRVVHQQLTVPSIEQYYYEVPVGKKAEVLSRLLDIYNPNLSLVFCNTKHMVDELVSELQLRGYTVEGLHGDMKQPSRTHVMSLFRSGKIDALVATDVAARGIDVDDIDAVFNYDIPQDEEYYVHRIGRTGRAGRSGRAFTFVTGRREIFSLRDIQRYTRAKIEHKAIPSSMEIKETRIAKFAENIKRVLKNEDLSEYLPIVDLLMDDDYTSVDVAAALIKELLPDDKQERSFIATPEDAILFMRNAEPSRSRVFPAREAPRRASPGYMEREIPGRVMLHINIGSSQNVTPNHILGAIAGETGLPGKIVGGIRIFEKHTIVDVPEAHAKQVIKAMKDCKIKGRKVSVDTEAKSKPTIKR